MNVQQLKDNGAIIRWDLQVYVCKVPEPLFFKATVAAWGLSKNYNETDHWMSLFTCVGAFISWRFL